MGELIRYGICGGITTGINLGLFYLMTRWNMHYIPANLLSYYIAVMVNFILNYRYVFQLSEETDKIPMLKRFVGLRTISIAVDSVIFWILVSVLQGPLYVSRVGLSVAMILINFVWSKQKIFKI